MQKFDDSKRTRCIACTILLFMMALIQGCQGNQSQQVSFQQPKVLITPEYLSQDEKDITNAFKSAIEGREDVLSFLIFDVIVDHIDINENRDLALIWISLSDPLNTEIIPMEAGLAIAKKTPDTIPQQNETQWEITLQADAEWEEALASIPTEMLDDETKSNYQTAIQAIQHAQKTYSGYRLPWAVGDSKYLTGSIGHVYLYKTCPRDCLYAFDFGDGSMWPVLAAKGGRVRYAVWQYPNGNTKHANYIVLEDTTTTPTTYQVYLHLAQDSIPVELRTPGAVVVQGQKIGVVDDTGVSTGHHLHFHVHTNPGYYWGTSVDITFDDVSVNGGRPRTCYEAKLYPSLGKQCQSGNLYVSGNNDKQLPTGGISSPIDGEVITDQFVTISGWAKDDMGIASVQVMLTHDGNWQMLGEPTSQSNFSTSIDLCEANVPDGDFFIALKIFDRAGKQAEGLPGIISLQKKFDCPLPPPQCEAGEDQVAVFEAAQYQGNCVVLDPGTYSAQTIENSGLTSIGSFQIGNAVYAQYRSNTNTTPIIASNLDTSTIDLTSLQGFTELNIIEKPPYPSAPTININSSRQNELITNQDQIIISWEDIHTSFEYRCKLLKDEKLIESMDWAQTTQWEISNLSPGDYQLYLDIRNVLGSTSTDIHFTVSEADLPPVTTLDAMPELITSTAFKISWSISEGADDLQLVRIRFQENGQDWQLLNQGFPPQVTETWFSGNSGSHYKFEISAVDLAGNEEAYHASPASAVQVEGGCLADPTDLLANGNDTIETASLIEFNIPQEHNLCPEDDRDWFSFVAENEAVYSITVVPENNSAAAVSIQLFSFTDANPITEVKATNYGESAKAVWSAPANGIYYIQISPINPGLAGTGTTYTIELKKIVQVHTPSLLVSTLILPALWAFLRISKIIISRFRKKQ